MKTARFTVETFIDVPLERVHAQLRDLRNTCEFHPLLIRVTELPREREEPDTQRCEMLERLTFGPFAWRSTYTATMRVVSSTELFAEAWAPAKVHLRNHFTLTTEGTGTRIVENVEIEAPGLLLGYAARTAEAAHTDQFARLRAAMEAGGLDPSRQERLA
jgi:hypothetical protein